MSRFISCAALSAYLFAFVVLPVLHSHSGEHEHEVKTCCSEQSIPVPAPDSDNSCTICEFAHLIVPLFMISEPLVQRSDIVDRAHFAIAIPLAVHTATLPPCRAPPVI